MITKRVSTLTIEQCLEHRSDIHMFANIIVAAAVVVGIDIKNSRWFIFCS